MSNRDNQIGSIHNLANVPATTGNWTNVKLNGVFMLEDIMLEGSRLIGIFYNAMTDEGPFFVDDYDVFGEDYEDFDDPRYSRDEEDVLDEWAEDQYEDRLFNP